MSERCEQSDGFIFCESAGASARKLTVSGKTSVKSDPHLYAELFTGKSLACDGLEMTVAFPLSLFQASPDVDEEGFSLRPGDEGDDILLAKSGSSSSGSLGTLLLQNY